jgi:hypothetical protein
MLEHLQVVPVRPFTARAVAVSGVSRVVHRLSRDPVKVRKAKDSREVWQAPVGDGESLEGLVNPAFVSSKPDWRTRGDIQSTYIVSGSLRKGLAAKAAEARERTQRRDV